MLPFLPLLRRDLPRGEKLFDSLPEFTNALPCFRRGGHQVCLAETERPPDPLQRPRPLTAFQPIHFRRHHQRRPSDLAQPGDRSDVELGGADERVHQLHGQQAAGVAREIGVDHLAPRPPVALRRPCETVPGQIDQPPAAVDPEPVHRPGPPRRGAGARDLLARQAIQETRLAHVRPTHERHLWRAVVDQVPGLRTGPDELRRFDLHDSLQLRR
jgi:hypothetical protein